MTEAGDSDKNTAVKSNLLAPHNYDLLKNSISFFREAVENAQRDEKDGGHWKFAIINLVQSMELALKEALKRIHPAFILENIDLPKTAKTISITRAIARLQSEHIGKFALSEDEAEQFLAAIKLRNQLVHQDGAFHAGHAEARFANIFAFMLFFYEDHLGIAREEIITQEQYSTIFALKKAKEELRVRALAHIVANKLGETWMCPDCFEDTFVVGDEACCLCGYAEAVHRCPNCDEKIFESETKDIFELYDYSVDEGRVRVIDRFGYENREACVHCYDQVKEDIQEKKLSKYYEEMEMEAYHRYRNW